MRGRDNLLKAMWFAANPEEKGRPNAVDDATSLALLTLYLFYLHKYHVGDVCI
jgi:hypothetical protein